MADSTYAPGMRVIIRDEEWMVRKVETNLLDNPALHTVGISPLVKDREAVFLTDLEDVEVVDPAAVRLVSDPSNGHMRTLLYLESQWRQQIPTDEKLHIGYKAAMDSLPYQWDPAALALSRPRQRILIADSVGLGKTLEAGILLSELIIRGRGKRILVVTTKSMLTQFQKEMWNRFTIPLVRLDSRKIQKIRSQLPSNYNPFSYYDKTIVSVDTLKRDVEYRTHLENATWDIIVIDEAQNVAERGKHQAQRARLAQLLADRSDTMILLSATPHDGRPRSFASLMNMLDPTAIANPDEYTKDDIKGLFIRRFKGDVKEQMEETFPERRVSIESCKASAREEAAFAVFTDMKLEMDHNKSHVAGMLFKTTLEKALFSSPAACIRSIDERLKKLRKKYADDEISDILQLEQLRRALEQIQPRDFSRYSQLKDLLNSYDYDWDPKDPEDRVVIFTERIETMKFLTQQLRKDLRLPDSAVQEMHGGMSDTELQRIVEEFSRTESPIRILVASDVASEGINLHHTSHRLIHFDIPWSLMVFQQRNGRIDRYGQRKQPDIRYMMIKSTNKEIRGDTRILEILIEKEKQAEKNIGDLAQIMRLFNIEAEELTTAAAMQNNSAADKEADPEGVLNRQIHTTGDGDDNSESPSSDEDEDWLSKLYTSDDDSNVETVEDKTLFTDIAYLKEALTFLNEKEQHPFTKYPGFEGIDLKMTPEIRRRMAALLPEEAMPKGDTLRLSYDAKTVMEAMRKSMQNPLDEHVWPVTQYLWPLHPIFNWVNDRCRLLYQRGEAPVIGILNQLKTDEMIFICSGSIPNRKSTPLVDEWFGVRYRGTDFADILSMKKVVQKCSLLPGKVPNFGKIGEAELQSASALRGDVVEHAKEYMRDRYLKFNDELAPKLDAELNKLTALEQQHRDYQTSLFTDEHRRDAAGRRVDDLFHKLYMWTEETMSIEDRPYIRIVAVLKGVTL